MNADKITNNIEGLYSDIRSLRADIQLLNTRHLFQKLLGHSNTFLQQWDNKLTDITQKLEDCTQRKSAHIKVALMGVFSCGKSSFINSLLGAQLAPVDINETTQTITCFTYGSELTIKDEKHKSYTLQDYAQTVQDPKQTHHFLITYPSVILEKMDFFDTIGLQGIAKEQRPEDEFVFQTSDILLYLLGDEQGTLEKNEVDLLKQLFDGRKKGPALLYIVLNKSDKRGQEGCIFVGKHIKTLCAQEGIQLEDVLFYASNMPENWLEPDFLISERERLLAELKKMALRYQLILKHKLTHILHTQTKEIDALKRTIADILQKLLPIANAEAEKVKGEIQEDKNKMLVFYTKQVETIAEECLKDWINVDTNYDNSLLIEQNSLWDFFKDPTYEVNLDYFDEIYDSWNKTNAYHYLKEKGKIPPEIRKGFEGIFDNYSLQKNLITELTQKYARWITKGVPKRERKKAIECIFHKVNDVFIQRSRLILPIKIDAYMKEQAEKKLCHAEELKKIIVELLKKYTIH